MYERHCDECGKLIEDDKDAYYTIEIERDVPIKKSWTVHTQSKSVKFQSQENDYDVNESWTTLNSIHFCEACWKKIGLKKYLK